MAMLFVPVLGSLIGKPQHVSAQNQARMIALQNGEFEQATGITKLYYLTLAVAIRHPVKILLAAILMAVEWASPTPKRALGPNFS